MNRIAPDVLRGASTAPHGIEGNNVNSDWWAREQVTPGMAFSRDAIDSYHRYGGDMRLPTHAEVGWTIADRALTAEPEDAARLGGVVRSGEAPTS